MIAHLMAAAFIAAIMLGIAKGIRNVRSPVQAVVSGWLYFAAGRDTQVKVGTSKEKPTTLDLPDSGVPLRILFKMEVPDTDAALAELDADIGEYQSRNRWYDRDAAMYYIDHLKGAV